MSREKDPDHAWGTSPAGVYADMSGDEWKQRNKEMDTVGPPRPEHHTLKELRPYSAGSEEPAIRETIC